MLLDFERSMPIANLFRSSFPSRISTTNADAYTLFSTCWYLVGADTNDRMKMNKFANEKMILQSWLNQTRKPQI